MQRDLGSNSYVDNFSYELSQEYSLFISIEVDVDIFSLPSQESNGKKDITTKLTLPFLLIAISFIYKILFFNYSLRSVNKNIKT